jgi:plasmid segregation protein ParM
MTTYTQQFKTTTSYLPQTNLRCGGEAWPVALDIGYSGTKGMSPNSAYSFPSFARELRGTPDGNPRPSDILYRDENGQEWMVGDFAIATLHADDTNDSQATLYGRHRYFSPMFLAIARTGIALGMMPNRNGKYRPGQRLYVQTGLPPAFLKDASLLKEVLLGEHSFSVKFGARKWQEFNFTLGDHDIGVIEQPKGAVVSASKTDTGRTVLGSGRKPYIEDRILVADGGFGTFDAISIYNRVTETEMSFTDVGMNAVFQLLSERLYKDYGAEISVHAIQNILDAGSVFAFDRASRSNRKVDIADALTQASRDVCERALDRLYL